MKGRPDTATEKTNHCLVVGNSMLSTPVVKCYFAQIQALLGELVKSLPSSRPVGPDGQNSFAPCMVAHISRVWINRVRLSILLVVS